jgi:hypothetical protein
MNKHQRKTSRKIKRLINELSEEWNFDYRSLKRVINLVGKLY